MKALISHSKPALWSTRRLLERAGQPGLTAAFQGSESQQYTASVCAAFVSPGRACCRLRTSVTSHGMGILCHQGRSHMDRTAQHSWEKSRIESDSRLSVFEVYPGTFISGAQFWPRVLRFIRGMPRVNPLTLTENDWVEVRDTHMTGTCLSVAPVSGLARINIPHSRNWDYELRDHMLPV